MSRPKTFRETLPRLAAVGRRTAPLLRRQRLRVAFAFTALFSQVFFRLLEPWPLKFVFDRLLPMAGSDVRTPENPWPLLLAAAGGLLFVVGMRSLAAYWSKISLAQIGHSVLTEVREQLFRHLQRLSMSFHTKARSGDLILRVTSDIRVLREIVTGALFPAIVAILTFFGMIGVMLWLNWRLTLVALLPLPLFWVASVRSGRRIMKATRQQRRRLSNLASMVSESLSSIHVVKSLSLEDDFGDAISRQNKKSMKEGVKMQRLMAGLERRVELLTAASRAVALGLGAYFVLRGELTAGDLVVFLSYFTRTYKPVRDSSKYAAKLSRAAAVGERVFEILEKVPDVRDDPKAVEAPPFRGAVRFDRVGFGYDAEHPVLEEIDFAVEPGTLVSIVGESGVGKSTLTSLVLRLYDPTAGRVMIDGRDIRELTVRSVRSQISVVLQDSLLFAASIRENIAFGSPNADLDRIVAAAREAGAHEFIERLEDGYDTVVGERGATLSTGQRQRITIARAAVRDAPILILDEPTSALDRENQHLIMESLSKLAEGRTTFLITHDLYWASRADLVLVLSGGRLAERGRHDELLERGGPYAALWRLRGESEAPPAGPDPVAGSGS